MSEMTEDMREAKAQAVQKELAGLPVSYSNHRDGLTPDMAAVNGHHIIWHEGAYCDPEVMEVEVYYKNRVLDGHVPIAGLREKVL